MTSIEHVPCITIVSDDDATRTLRYWFGGSIKSVNSFGAICAPDVAATVTAVASSTDQIATRVVVAARSPLCFVPTPNSAFRSPRGFEKCAVNTASVDVAGGNFIEHVVDAFVITTLPLQC